MHTIRSQTIVAAGALMLSASVAFGQDAIQLTSTELPPTKSRGRTGVPVPSVRQAAPAPRADLRNVLKNVQASFQNQAQTLRQDATAKLKEATTASTMAKVRLSVVVRQHIGEIARRFSVALLQFDNLTARIQSRLDKLKAA